MQECCAEENNPDLLIKSRADGYVVSTHQSEIIPRKLQPVWEAPDNYGKALHERTHEWRLGWCFTIAGNESFVVYSSFP